MNRVKLADRVLPTYSKGEEILNMVSHIVGASLGIIALVLCVIFSAIHNNFYGIIAISLNCTCNNPLNIILNSKKYNT